MEHWPKSSYVRLYFGLSGPKDENLAIKEVSQPRPHTLTILIEAKINSRFLPQHRTATDTRQINVVQQKNEEFKL